MPIVKLRHFYIFHLQGLYEYCSLLYEESKQKTSELTLSQSYEVFRVKLRVGYLAMGK